MEGKTGRDAIGLECAKPIGDQSVINRDLSVAGPLRFHQVDACGNHPFHDGPACPERLRVVSPLCCCRSSLAREESQHPLVARRILITQLDTSDWIKNIHLRASMS